MLAKKLRKLADNLAGQPTDLAGVGCSVFFILRSVDIFSECRLFGVLHSSFGRRI
jgi:hypothetical protein